MPCLPFAFVVFAICQNVLCRFSPFSSFKRLPLFIFRFFFSLSSFLFYFLSLTPALSLFAWLCLCTLLPFCLCRRVICFCLLWQLVEFILSIQTHTHIHTHTHLLSPINIYTHTHSVWSPLWLAHRASIGTRPAWIFIDFAVVGCSDWSIDWLINWHFAH